MSMRVASIILVVLLAIGAVVVGVRHKETVPMPTATSTVSTSTSTKATSTPSGGQGIMAYNSGIEGRLLLGPTCPVERNPPDPNCTDKPYSTLVTIFRASDPTHALVITRSDKLGQFKASLPPGEYLVGAGESMLPRCPETRVSVLPKGYATTTIFCDTGIR